MVYGLGTDTIQVERIRRLIDNPADSFFQKTFTEYELEQAFRTAQPEVYLAGRFAAKEAVFKCFAMDGSLIHWNEIEIRSNLWGAPTAHVKGILAMRLKEMGDAKIFVSITHETDYANAVAAISAVPETL